ncbi:ATP-dependent Clp protease proteolytic subunit [Heliobacterium chlorum]|uniref:ATP-dependent Clp protease proteolytic subunit n=1 Tax=Heliobacterium chlorum TaxID=2698 RepID=A0ABR7T337_HELCL|nr:ATP-dependent Clp protease proteolytic subunit [Heliobacterium chlorum]MBC9785192.1 ATP-dependent Clp protease proteolytic subunit [Heliobacterium chlorum]
MPQNRRELIQTISEMRKSSVICYIGGDRQNVSTRVAPDIIPVIYKHLEEMDNLEKIDLFLFTKGGDVHTPLRLVELIREYTEHFSVLVPYKAYSAGTLICLGATELVMTKMGELSPVDPNVVSMFNPPDKENPAAKLPINVEDVYSFFTLAREAAGIPDESMDDIFCTLVENVHPLAIGSVQRTYSLIRSIAKKLLLCHMDAGQEDVIDEIISNLTEKMFSHSYMISRREAALSLKLPVSYCSPELEKVMWSLFTKYSHDLLLDVPFIPERAANMSGEFSVCSGIIETVKRTDGYFFEGVIQKLNENQNNICISNQGWEEIEEE